MNQFTPITPYRAQLGECPRWDEQSALLYWVDITAPALHTFDPITKTHTIYPTHEHIGCFALHSSGNIIAGMRSGIWVLTPDAQPIKKLVDNPENQSISRFNDGRADIKGRFWLGTVDEDKSQSGACLYVYDGMTLKTIKTGLLTSNGLAFSPENNILYHSDTPRFTVFKHEIDMDSGNLAKSEIFLNMPREIYGNGRPDGAAVDEEGYYWSALFEGNAVIRVSPEGEIVETHTIEAKCPTMCAFGGENLDTLYVTTASIGRSHDELQHYPLSGAVFAKKISVRGRIEPRCQFNIE